ncbi:MAG TPA: hypothetical protein VE010_23030 [Thermoanaerobaculia bacterium]|nr:hypothetical protein [Thermoanaerobaculia bacterium]
MIEWSSEIGGWALLCVTPSLLLLFRVFRNQLALWGATLLAIAAHDAVAIYNVYVRAVIGAQQDAIAFHLTAYGLATGGWTDPRMLAIPYTHFLALGYSIFGASQFVGAQLSILAFAASCAVLIKLMDALEIRRFRVSILLLYGLLPTGLINGSVTLREPYQMLFVLLLVHYTLALRDRLTLWNAARVMLAATALAFLHNGLAAYAVLYVVAGVLWASGTRGRRLFTWKRVGGLLLVLLAIAVYLGRSGSSSASHASNALRSGKVLEYAKTYRGGQETEARAYYGGSFDDSSVPALVRSGFLIVYYYMFAPLPWQVQNTVDVYAMLEGFLRLVLLVAGVVHWRTAKGELRARLWFLWMVFLSLETMWALGTVNWGASLRHHLPAYGLLLLLGAPVVFRALYGMLVGVFAPPPSLITAGGDVQQ